MAILIGTASSVTLSHDRSVVWSHSNGKNCRKNLNDRKVVWGLPVPRGLGKVLFSWIGRQSICVFEPRDRYIPVTKTTAPPTEYRFLDSKRRAVMQHPVSIVFFLAALLSTVQAVFDTTSPPCPNGTWVPITFIQNTSRGPISFPTFFTSGCSEHWDDDSDGWMKDTLLREMSHATPCYDDRIGVPPITFTVNTSRGPLYFPAPRCSNRTRSV